jgi:histidinol-phosphate aminotransferase
MPGHATERLGTCIGRCIVRAAARATVRRSLSLDIETPHASGLFRSALATIAPYNAGLSADHVRRLYGIGDVVKLASNENPLGASKAAHAAIAEAIGTVCVYPDPACTALREVIGGSLGIPPDCLVFGNGSEELIAIACRAFLDPRDEVIVSSPTFSVAADNATVMGARVLDVPRRPNLTLDADAIEAAISPTAKILYLCNPNNPTGTMVPRHEFASICRAAGRDTLIIVDEAYYEYARGEDEYPDSLQFLPSIDAASLVLRPVSKAYGLAGLRVGYGVASSAAVARQLDSVRTAFNVNHLAQAAAVAAWSDQDHVARSVAHNEGERIRLAAALRQRGFDPAPSATNFLFFDTWQQSREIADRLLRRGVIVKPWGGAFTTYIRVSIGTAAQNDQFLAALDEACA